MFSQNKTFHKTKHKYFVIKACSPNNIFTKETTSISHENVPGLCYKRNIHMFANKRYDFCLTTTIFADIEGVINPNGKEPKDYNEGTDVSYRL